MLKPNFFIVGAPKCGTTALCTYLSEHENAYISHPKEPHYFAFDYENYRSAKSIEDYLALFQGASESHLALGEGSVFYLYSEVAVREILKYNSIAKVIVMIRNPVEMVQSLYSQLKVSADEDAPDFQTAWAMQHERSMGRKIPSRCREKSFLQYRKMGLLGEQVSRLMELIPREQIKIILFDDFVSETDVVYSEVLEFLGLPKDTRTLFPKVNPNKKYKSSILGVFTAQPPVWLVNIAMNIKKYLGIEKLNILDSLRGINTEVASREAISEKLQNELKQAFKEDVQKLGLLTGRDLGHWTEISEK